MLPAYPELAELTLEQRSELQAPLRAVPAGLATLTFASLFLNRRLDDLRVGSLPGGGVVFSGQFPGGSPFFLLPLGLPAPDLLHELFGRFRTLALLTAEQAPVVGSLGYRLREDRNNSEYLYRRTDLATLPGRRFEKRRNRVNAFVKHFRPEARPLLPGAATDDARRVTLRWAEEHDDPGDLEQALEALDLHEPLEQCGMVYYAEGRPVGWALGEEVAQGRIMAVHFEKAIQTDRYKGIYQYICQAFAACLPEKYDLVNREQDLGDPGLREAKLQNGPCAFATAYVATLPPYDELAEVQLR